MSTAAIEATLTADLAPLEGVESLLVRHMARAHTLAEACFARAEQMGAEQAETPAPRHAELRLGLRLLTLFSRALGALERRRARVRQELKAAVKQEQSAQFDHVLQLAAIADAAVAQKAKGGAAAAAGKPPPAAPPGEVPPRNRHERRAAEHRLRKAGGPA